MAETEYKTLEGGELILAIIFAIFIPPLAVWMRAGIGTQFWINIILCFCGWLPAVVHTLWLIFFTDPTPKEI